MADMLRDMGCNEAQGYLYAKPLAPDVFEWGWASQLAAPGISI
jgi:EAL domain-containing protein (putative c-di-GMP-specific phosphodiesterase class I)